MVFFVALVVWLGFLLKAFEVGVCKFVDFLQMAKFSMDLLRFAFGKYALLAREREDAWVAGLLGVGAECGGCRARVYQDVP